MTAKAATPGMPNMPDTAKVNQLKGKAKPASAPKKLIAKITKNPTTQLRTTLPATFQNPEGKKEIANKNPIPHNIKSATLNKSLSKLNIKITPFLAFYYLYEPC
jgi:hypothetical protein